MIVPIDKRDPEEIRQMLEDHLADFEETMRSLDEAQVCSIETLMMEFTV